MKFTADTCCLHNNMLHSCTSDELMSVDFSKLNSGCYPSQFKHTVLDILAPLGQTTLSVVHL